MDQLPEIAKTLVVYLLALLVLVAAVTVWNHGPVARPANAASVASSPGETDQP